MGNKAARLQQEKEAEARLKGQLKELPTIVKLFEEVVAFGNNNNNNVICRLSLEDFKVAFIGFFKSKHRCNVNVKGLRTIENALWYQFMQMYNNNEYNNSKDGEQQFLFLFCRFIESILIIKQLSRFITAVLNMFLIEKDSVNISMMNGILNVMIYFLREPTVKSDKDKNMYSLGLPTNFFATDRDDFEKYLKIKLPMLVLQLPIFVSKCILPGSQSGVYDFQYRVPKPLNENDNSELLSPTDFHVLATTSLSFSKHKYEKLFSTTDKGFGFGNLVDSLEGYSGPTLLVIQDTFGNVFGGFTCNEWQQSKTFYGNENCFIFSVQPNFGVLSPRITNSAVNTNFQYLCSKNHHSKALHGIGFGGDPKYTRLFLSSDFKTNCTCRSTGLSFDQGSLLKMNKNDHPDNTNDDESFVASVVEIWGFGVSQFYSAKLKVKIISNLCHLFRHA
jgi:hypothetical protein